MNYEVLSISLENQIFCDIEAKLYLDGGILLSLWLHYFAADSEWRRQI